MKCRGYQVNWPALLSTVVDAPKTPSERNVTCVPTPSAYPSCISHVSIGVIGARRVGTKWAAADGEHGNPGLEVARYMQRVCSGSVAL